MKMRPFFLPDKSGKSYVRFARNHEQKAHKTGTFRLFA